MPADAFHIQFMLLLEQRRSYRKDPKIWDAINFCCKLPKIQTKRPNPRVLCQNDANGIANSEDPDQTAS